MTNDLNAAGEGPAVFALPLCKRIPHLRAILERAQGPVEGHDGGNLLHAVDLASERLEKLWFVQVVLVRLHHTPTQSPDPEVVLTRDGLHQAGIRFSTGNRHRGLPRVGQEPVRDTSVVPTRQRQEDERCQDHHADHHQETKAEGAQAFDHESFQR
jgi:hypothetical protein